ncbi:MAG: hypothetical protein GX819_05485 [Clostridiaceae bacterium]|nr:hypothetical protein [Clostridiaceae bacterium]
MATYQARLYMVLYPTEALILSQLSPKDFVVRYSYGSVSYYEGKLIFAELDINYRDPYFQIDQAMKGLVLHSDGRPKATQYVSSYRVLEHVSIDAIQALFLGNPDGSVLELKEVDTFMDRFKQNPFVPSPIVGIHPAKLRDAILDMESKPKSLSKGLTLHNILARQSYRSITRGLMFMDKDQEKFFPMPPLDQIEEENYPFYKSM